MAIRLPIRQHQIAIALCGGLLLLFAMVAWLAVQSKSPAYDEPYHAISSWLQFRFLDFRFDNEDPPLWQYWASLPNGRMALTADFDSQYWKDMPGSLVHQWYWGVQTLYRTAGNDPVRLITRCRAMMLLLALLLGVIICCWAWQLAGPVAAVVACSLFCLDPNFLAHSPLMKNDVAFAMSMFALGFVIWKAGRKLNGEAVGWILLLSLVTLTVKFSGLVAVVLVPLLLSLRAVMPMPWPVLNSVISNRLQRVLVAIAVTLASAIVSYGGIWAVYGFRFAPIPQKQVRLDLQPIIREIRTNVTMAKDAGSPPPGAEPAKELPLVVNAAMFANDHTLLPQAFIAGFLFTYSNSVIRPSYLCGQISPVGWWWYFPFAILVKTPVATLISIFATDWIAFRFALRKGFKSAEKAWAATCLAVPVILFFASAMASGVNIGLRHVLAIYPFIFVAIGCVVASIWRKRHKKSQFVIVGLVLMLAIESLSTFPNFIPYFNVLSTTASTKLQMLGDSNLDWGQDLLLLAQWQREHPKQTLYLSYFGYADPAYYGIKYIPLPGGYHYDSPPHWPDPYAHSVIAISASNLQGILEDPKLRADFYDKWKARKPAVVLGDSIYLFAY